MAAWAMSSAGKAVLRHSVHSKLKNNRSVADACISGTIIAAMYKHRRKAEGMQNMESVKNTLMRGMLYVVESM